MTAEIAIMNYSAVALAADSAITIKSGSRTKIYQTNKLFALSKYQPVGIMIYNNANIMSVPWESIIKYFRMELGDKTYDTLEEYGNQFISFLDNNVYLFPEAEQQRYFYSMIISYLYVVRKSIDDEIEVITHKKGKITKREIQNTVNKNIKQFHDDFESMQSLSTVPQNYVEETLRKYDDILNQAIKEAFTKLTVSISAQNQLKRFCVNLFTKDFPHPAYSGLVIAGFGTNDLYPSLAAYRIEGLVNDRLKYKLEGTTKIQRDMSAAIVPFAQREMVYAFIEGVDPKYLETVHQYLHALFDKYPQELIKFIPNLTATQKKELALKLRGIGSTLVAEFMSGIKKYSKDRHISPILSTVAVLPLSELASMAESLVNLTSFKRRVTLVEETVGGPIDVAIISKGDGFIWIKRKHYFDASANPQFFANYYR